MHVGIVGAGAIGAPLAKRLSQSGEKILLIDAKEERCKEISETADAEIFIGDGRDPELLRKAGMQNVDVLLALTDDDDANSAICQVAKTVFGIPVVVTLANSPTMLATLRKAGADRVICPEEEAITLFEKAVMRRSVETLFHDLTSRIKLVRVNVSTESKAIGNTISKLHLPKGCRGFMIVRDNTPIYLEGQGRRTTIQMGDEVYLVGPSDQIDSAESISLI